MPTLNIYISYFIRVGCDVHTRLCLRMFQLFASFYSMTVFRNAV